MATETLSQSQASIGARTISERRHELASRAQHEIGQAASALRDAIIELNLASSIPKLWLPTLLRRIELLSDATSECLGNGADWDDAALERIISEANHG